MACTADSAVACPEKTLAPLSPSKPYSSLSLPTTHTMGFDPTESVTLTAGEPKRTGPAHQATTGVGVGDPEIFIADRPPDSPAGHPMGSLTGPFAPLVSFLNTT